MTKSVSLYGFLACNSIDELTEPQRAASARFVTRNEQVRQHDLRDLEYTERDVRPYACLTITITGDIQALQHNPNKGCLIYGADDEMKAAVNAVGKRLYFQSGLRFEGWGN